MPGLTTNDTDQDLGGIIPLAPNTHFIRTPVQWPKTIQHHHSIGGPGHELRSGRGGTGVVVSDARAPGRVPSAEGRYLVLGSR